MIRVLVVDDNPREPDRYRAFLEPLQAEVVVTASGAEAERETADHRSTIHLAIVLWELSGRPSGVELVKRLGRMRPGLPVIVVSGHLDRSRAAMAASYGARDFILKPLDGDRLAGAVKRLLQTEPESPILQALKAGIVGQSRQLLHALESLAKVIPQRDANVLLIGESGTGKELLARAVHDLGPEAKLPWVPVNVSAIPKTLIETHLFGSEAGAYTDAKTSRQGYFEESGEGTLFLDEIGELETPLQTTLLRVLEERSFRRVGGQEDKRFAARLVCATNLDLATATRTGRFRPDLYFRIATHEIHVPALRDRGDDLWLLVDHFLTRFAAGRELHLGREARCLLAEYPFPGNVRELEDIVRGAAIGCDGDEILPYHLPIKSLSQRGRDPQTQVAQTDIVLPQRLFELGLKEATDEVTLVLDREYLRRKLAEANNRLTAAAKKAGVDKNTFRARWERAGLEPAPWQE